MDAGVCACSGSIETAQWENFVYTSRANVVCASNDACSRPTPLDCVPLARADLAMKKRRVLLHVLLLALFVAHGSGWAALCAPCAAAPQPMACHAGADVTIGVPCCCGAMVCGEVEADAPSLAAVEIAHDVQWQPAIKQVLTVLQPGVRVEKPIAATPSVPHPLFQLYCSLLI